MTIESITDLQSRLSVYDHKLDLLLRKGGNDEKLVAKRKELLTQYFKLKNEKK